MHGQQNIKNSFKQFSFLYSRIFWRVSSKKRQFRVSNKKSPPVWAWNNRCEFWKS